MTDPSVSETWANAIAAELHRIADDFAKVDTFHSGDALPMPRSITLSIQPGGPNCAADDEVIGTVDAIGRALFGTTGQIQGMSDGSFHYKVEGRSSAVTVAVFREISAGRVEQIRAGAVLAEKEGELARLRAEVAKLRAEATGAPERQGPWFEVGDRVTPKGWEKTGYARRGLNLFAAVVEVKPITLSDPARQQFRSEGADWCGAGSIWFHSDSYELAPDDDPTTDRYAPSLIVGDTADEQRDNAYAARCPNCHGRHHTVEPCR